MAASAASGDAQAGQMMLRRTDADWFDLPKSRLAQVLRPRSIPSEVVAGGGTHRIRVSGIEISFSAEDPGWLISFEGDLLEADAQRIVDEICRNIVEFTAQEAVVVPL